MCGRFALYDSPRRIARFFEASVDERICEEHQPSWNIAPTRSVLALTVPPAVAAGPHLRALLSYRWGLVPSWAKDLSIGNRLFNARAETVADKPSYRSAFRRRRCLVVANGFYEWRPSPEPIGPRQPYYFCRSDGEPLAFAGLWESWPAAGQTEGEPPLLTCTVITTRANRDIEDVHDRMPAIVERDDWDEWLDPGVGEDRHLARILAPAPGSTIIGSKVGTAVNSVRNDGEGLIDPLE